MKKIRPFFNIAAAILALTGLMTSTALADGFGAPSLAESVSTTPTPMWTGFYGTTVDFTIDWASNNAGQGMGFTSPGGTTTIEANSGMWEDVTAGVNITAGPGCDPADCAINNVFFDGAWTASNDVSTHSIVTGGGISTAPITANAQAMTAGIIQGGIGVQWTSTDVAPVVVTTP